MSQSNTLWSQSLDHDSKQDISKFIKADDKDRNESLRAIADFAKGGGGGAQSYPITVTGDAGAYIFDGQGWPTVQITERAAGEYVVIKADKPLSSENTSVLGDTVDYVPVLFDYSSDAPNQAYFIMPAGATYITVS